MERACDEASALLGRPEHAWAAEAIHLYLDARAHLHLSPEDLTPWGHAAFRAIRQGSGGLLGAPSL